MSFYKFKLYDPNINFTFTFQDEQQMQSFIDNNSIKSEYEMWVEPECRFKVEYTGEHLTQFKRINGKEKIREIFAESGITCMAELSHFALKHKPNKYNWIPKNNPKYMTVVNEEDKTSYKIIEIETGNIVSKEVFEALKIGD